MSSDRAYYRLAFKMFADFSGVIAVPAVLAALAGKWLDTRYHTNQKFLIVLFFFAFLFTAAFVWKKAKNYKEEFENIGK